MAATTAMTGAGVLALEPARSNGSDSGSGDEGLFADTLEQVIQGDTKTPSGEDSEPQQAPLAGEAEQAVPPHGEGADGPAEGLDRVVLDGVAPAVTEAAVEQPEAVAETADALSLFLTQLATTPVARNAVSDGVAEGQQAVLGVLPGGKKLPLLPPAERLATLKLRSAERLQGGATEALKAEAPLNTSPDDGQEGVRPEGEALQGDDAGLPDRLNGLHNAVKSAVTNQLLVQGSRPDRAAAMLPEALQGTEPEALQPASGSQPGSAGATPAIRAANASLPSFNLPQPMQHKGWEQAMGERMVWMARNSIQQAKLQLNPRDMGPVEVRVSLNQDQASVHFVAQQAATRDALEQALPRLREMFQESGLNLAQSEVSQHDFRRRGEGSGEAAGQGGDSAADEALAEQEDVLVGQAPLPDGAVDYYA